MELRNKIGIVKAFINEKLFSRRAPVLVSWHLLNRCNRRCQYCYRWSEQTKELDTKEIFLTIGRLKKMGTQVIMFSGGEPLLRDDIADIIRCCRNKGIFVGLTSNGDFVEKRISGLKGLNVLKLSFEGPKETHDLLRGEGSWEGVMRATRAAKESNIITKYSTNLTSYNIDCIDYILQKSRELNVGVKFNPVTYVHSCGKDISFLFPKSDKYKHAIEKLILLKKKNPYIINSTAGLRYLYNWPIHSDLKCHAGKLNCCIAPNGEVYPCALLMGRKGGAPSCLSREFKKEFQGLYGINFCTGCWCSTTLELNYLLSFNIGAVLNIGTFFSR